MEEIIVKVSDFKIIGFNSTIKLSFSKEQSDKFKNGMKFSEFVKMIGVKDDLILLRNISPIELNSNDVNAMNNLEFELVTDLIK